MFLIKFVLLKVVLNATISLLIQINNITYIKGYRYDKIEKEARSNSFGFKEK